MGVGLPTPKPSAVKLASRRVLPALPAGIGFRTVRANLEFTFRKSQGRYARYVADFEHNLAAKYSAPETSRFRISLMELAPSVPESRSRIIVAPASVPGSVKAVAESSPLGSGVWCLHFGVASTSVCEWVSVPEELPRTTVVPSGFSNNRVSATDSAPLAFPVRRNSPSQWRPSHLAAHQSKLFDL